MSERSQDDDGDGSFSRRRFLEMAGAFGAVAVLGRGTEVSAATAGHERRDLYPEGVASGDPSADSVLLWTRRAPANGPAATRLNPELS